jgi:UDP-glucose 4-epimerase
MKILVTGGAGFIASHVVDRYIELGHKVVVVDNLVTGNQSNLNPKAKFYELDIRDPELAKVFEKEKPEIVNHHAAHIDVRKSVEDPSYDAQVNILGSINLLRAAVQNGVKKVIYISTAGAVYGEPESLPIFENSPINPICPYGISKHTVEHYLFQTSRTDGLKYTVLRYPNVYGPRQDPRGEAGVNAIFIGMMLQGKVPTIYGKGHECRDYVYVGDLVEANAAVLDRGDGEIYNLGSNTGTTVDQLFQILAGLLNFHKEPKRASLRPGEIERIYIDGGKAGRELGWKPKVDLKTGLSMTVDFYRKHPEYLR